MADPKDSAGPPSPGLFASVRSFWSVLVAILYTRLDLLTAELQASAVSVLQILLAGVISVLALTTAFFFANVWIIAAFWYTPYRMWVIGIIFGVYFLIGLIALAYARNAVATWPGLLSHTIKELRKDVEGLSRLSAKDKEDK